MTPETAQALERLLPKLPEPINATYTEEAGRRVPWRPGTPFYTAEQMRTYALATLRAQLAGRDGGGDKPDAWWNGQRPTNDGICIPSINWDGEDTNHDIPLFAGFNPQGPVMRMLADYKARAEKAEATLHTNPAPSVVSEWRPIESAPKDGTRIAIRFKSGRENEANWQTTYGGEWHVDSFKHLPWSDQHEITHWRPLPAPPALTEGGSRE